MKHFDRLYKIIMEEVADFNFTKEEKQLVIDVLKTFGKYDEWKDYVDQIAEQMINGHGYSKYQIDHLDKQGLEAILNDVDSGWLDEHEQYVPEDEENFDDKKLKHESKRISTKKKLIKESVRPSRRKRVIKEDSNPDVQDQADCLNGFMEDHPEIDWEYAADYELDCVLNTCLFYLNDDAENAWPKCHFSEFATDEWDEEEDDHVYVNGEELFRDAYRYKFCCGIFYLADELYDFVMKYGSGDDKVIAELDAMRNDYEDIIYVDWYDEGPDDPEFQKFVDKAVGYLGNLCGKFSDIDRVKFDVLRQIASEIR